MFSCKNLRDKNIKLLVLSVGLNSEQAEQVLNHCGVFYKVIIGCTDSKIN